MFVNINGPKNGFAWCDQFYDWLMYKCFGKEAALKLLCQPAYSAGAGCYYSAMYYKQRGQFHASGPQPGDQVFFAYSAGEVSHTGIVVSVSGSTVNTIEGNTSDGVYLRSYSVSSSQIYGYGRPDWRLANEATAASAANDEITRVAAEIIDGKWGNGAERVARLIAAGYDCVAVQNRVNELLQKEEAAPSTSAADVSESDTPAAVYTLELAELSKGMKGAAVRRVQVLLIDRAYKCGGKIRSGREEPDGDFGPMTVAAIEAFGDPDGADRGLHTLRLRDAC